MRQYPAGILNYCLPSGRMVFSNKVACLLSWYLRPLFLRERGGGRGVLFAGPWVGEFGWELMNWQGYIRSLGRSYEKVVVSCRESSRALYEDFCDEFLFHDLRGTVNCNVLRGIRNRDELERLVRAIPAGADHLQPLKYIPAGSQEFVRFGAVREGMVTDLLIHARGKEDVGERNWTLDKWNALVKAARKRGLAIGSIGLREDTVDVDGTTDFRGRPLSETMDAVASTGLVLGPSSGPMHLSALCGTPHLVWTDRKTYSMGKSSREKYESWWNPLGTPVRVVDEHGFDPPVDRVLKEVERMLA